MPDQRQCEVRVEELTERREQREEQQPETDEHEPVCDTDMGPLEHSGMPQSLLDHIDRAGLGVIGAIDRLTKLDHSQDVPDRPDEQGDTDDRDGQRDDRRDDLHGLHVVAAPRQGSAEALAADGQPIVSVPSGRDGRRPCAGFVRPSRVIRGHRLGGRW